MEEHVNKKLLTVREVAFATVLLQDLLTHLYVLIRVLDNEKHYWVANDEIEKLLKRGEGWLGAHPEKDLIVSSMGCNTKTLCSSRLARADHSHGTVTHITMGTSPENDGSDSYYLNPPVVSDDPKGVGAFLLAGSEMELRHNKWLSILRSEKHVPVPHQSSKVSQCVSGHRCGTSIEVHHRSCVRSPILQAKAGTYETRLSKCADE
jgi:hypothetical protein